MVLLSDTLHVEASACNWVNFEASRTPKPQHVNDDPRTLHRTSKQILSEAFNEAKVTRPTSQASENLSARNPLPARWDFKLAY